MLIDLPLLATFLHSGGFKRYILPPSESHWDLAQFPLSLSWDKEP